MPPVNSVLFDPLVLPPLICVMSTCGITTAPPAPAICRESLLSPQEAPAFAPRYQPFQYDSCAAAGAAAASMARDAPAASNESRRVEMIVTRGPSRESRGSRNIVAVAAGVSRVDALDRARNGLKETASTLRPGMRLHRRAGSSKSL